jgi:hypothetical protein
MNAQEERDRAVRDRAGEWRGEGLISEETRRAVEASIVVSWRSYGVVAQCVFFILTAIGMAAAYGLSHVVGLPLRGVFAGVAFVATAEFLIHQKWFGTGVEAALWIGGLIAMISELPSSGKPEAMLVFAAVCAIAGARVRNPIFGAAAAIFVMIYAEKKGDLGVVTALVIAGIAVLALLREWRRPSTEWLWIVIALALPVAGRFTADDKWWRMTIALYATFGAVALVLAIVKRHHALFFSGAIGLAIAQVELSRKVLSLPLEAKLATGGVFLFALATIVSRALRTRTTGLVVTPSNLTGADEALSVAGALVAHRASQADIPSEPAPAETRAQGDGGFGGAGATGDY